MISKFVTQRRESYANALPQHIRQHAQQRIMRERTYITSPSIQQWSIHFRDKKTPWQLLTSLLSTMTTQYCRRIHSFKPVLAVMVCTSLRSALNRRDFECLHVWLTDLVCPFGWLVFNFQSFHHKQNEKTLSQGEN